MKYLIFLLLFTGCSQWYLVDTVELKPKDIKTISEVIDTTNPIGTIRSFQKATSYDWWDFGIGSAFAITEGIGLGFYESKVYYSPRAFPGAQGTWFYDWVNMNTGGDQWMKIGHPDKIGRSMWIVSTKISWNRYLRFFGGNWVFAYLTQFTISNTVAEIIRQQAKYGTFTLSFDLDWRILDSLFD